MIYACRPCSVSIGLHGNKCNERQGESSVRDYSDKSNERN